MALDAKMDNAELPWVESEARVRINKETVIIARYFSCEG
jgi:hypothetical protein